MITAEEFRILNLLTPDWLGDNRVGVSPYPMLEAHAWCMMSFGYKEKDIHLLGAIEFNGRSFTAKQCALIECSWTYLFLDHTVTLTHDTPKLPMDERHLVYHSLEHWDEPLCACQALLNLRGEPTHDNKGMLLHLDVPIFAGIEIPVDYDWPGVTEPYDDWSGVVA